MKAFCMGCFCLSLKLCYFFIKLCTRQTDKILFLSRQKDVPGLDFLMLSEELHKQAPHLKQKMLCKTIGKGLSGKLLYGFHLFAQMGHIATAKAVILDGYCIAACVLTHKKGTKIYQIWHALGLLKQFGYGVIGEAEGSSAITAKIMNMHRGYHKIVCSSEHVIPGIAKCYDAPESLFAPVGLPRVDFLRSQSLMTQKAAEIKTLYPAMTEHKPVVLYVPTFRKNTATSPPDLAAALNLERYHLVIKHHDGSEQVHTSEGVFDAHSPFTGMEWLSIADYVITDYSAILFEAFCAQKPVILFCYDKAYYDTARGFAISFDTIPAPICQTPEQVKFALEAQSFPHAGVADFCRFHLPPESANCTQALAVLILQDF